MICVADDFNKLAIADNSAALEKASHAALPNPGRAVHPACTKSALEATLSQSRAAAVRSRLTTRMLSIWIPTHGVGSRRLDQCCFPIRVAKWVLKQNNGQKHARAVPWKWEAESALQCYRYGFRLGAWLLAENATSQSGSRASSRVVKGCCEIVLVAKNAQHQYARPITLREEVWEQGLRYFNSIRPCQASFRCSKKDGRQAREDRPLH